MAQFWRRLVVIVYISLGCAYAAESSSSDGRDANFKLWYKTADSTIRACNSSSCRAREACLTTVRDKLLSSELKLEGSKQVLTITDWNPILARTIELEKMNIFYGALLLIKNTMLLDAWKAYKKGQRIKDTYLADLAVSSQTPGIPMDMNENAVFMLLLQRSFAEGKIESEGYDYEKIAENINKLNAFPFD